MTHHTGEPGNLHEMPRPSAPASVNTPVFRQLLEQYADASADKAQRAVALAAMVDHLETQLATARYQALFEELPADQAMLGERITRKSYQTLSSLSTYMAVALQLLPTVSWHDGAKASCKELKAMLQRNFAVQITLEESRGAYSTAPMHAPADVALKLPREWYGNEVPRGVVAGFHAYISDVLALRSRPTEVNGLPKPLRWLDRVDSYFVTGYNECRDKVITMNHLVEKELQKA